MAVSPKHVTFVTRELPSNQSVEGLVVARIIESLPLDWKVKVFVIRSRLLLTQAFPALPEVEVIHISEPQYEWDNFLLRTFRCPLEKLATKESIQISKRILTDSSRSEFVLVFSTSPVLNLVLGELEATSSNEKQCASLGVSNEDEKEINLKVFTEQSGNIPENEWRRLFENANCNHFSHETLGTLASNVFSFNPLMKRKHQSRSDVITDKIGTKSRNRLVDWDSSIQTITESGNLILSSRLAYVLSPMRIQRTIAQFFSPVVMKALNEVFKFGFASLKSFFHALSIVRKAISTNR